MRAFWAIAASGATPGATPDGLMRRVALLDQNRRHVIGNRALVDIFEVGNPGAQLMVVPVSLAEMPGNVVGYLLHQALPRLNNEVDIAFARSQWQQVLLTAAALLMLSGAVAFFLARWFLVPVRALGEAARALAAGDYTARVAASSAGRRDEIGALAQDFNRAASALAANQSARQRWTADIAHELRTPLTILQGDLQALREGVRTPDARAGLTHRGVRAAGARR